MTATGTVLPDITVEDGLARRMIENVSDGGHRWPGATTKSSTSGLATDRRHVTTPVVQADGGIQHGEAARASNCRRALRRRSTTFCVGGATNSSRVRIYNVLNSKRRPGDQSDVRPTLPRE